MGVRTLDQAPFVAFAVPPLCSSIHVAARYYNAPSSPLYSSNRTFAAKEGGRRLRSTVDSMSMQQRVRVCGEC